jgi:hypothetical protein
MKGKVRTALIYVIQPRTIIFFIALFNFVWFFSKSRIVVEFGSTAISFCLYCPWYWDWSLANLPSLSLIAAICLLFARWKGYLAACIISGYQIIDGINWLSRFRSFSSGFSQRLEVISESNLTNIWELLDIQYLLAMIIFITALTYLVVNILDRKRTPGISYP